MNILSKNFRDLGFTLGLFVLCWAAYSNCLHNEFVVDDYGLIVRNTGIRQASDLQLNLFAPRQLGYGIDYYRPIVHGLIVVDYLLFGFNPVGYHAVNLALFFLGSWALFLVIRRISGEARLAWVTAALYAVHPINGALVNYKTMTGITLMVLCLWGSLGWLLAWREAPPKKHFLIGSVLLFATALLCHELAVFFLLYMAAALMFTTNVRLRETVRMMLPFVGVLGVYLVIRFLFTGMGGNLASKYSGPGSSLANYLTGFPVLVGWYLGKLFLPMHVVYSWGTGAGFKGQLWPAVVLGVLVLCLLVKILKVYRRGVMALSLTWLLLGLLPLLVACPIDRRAGLVIEPHWLLFSSAGFFLYAGALVSRLIDRGRWLGWGVLVFLLTVYAWGSRTHNFYWGNEVRYCRFWLEEFPENPTTKFILAQALLRQGAVEESGQLFQGLLNGKKEDWEVYANLGLMAA